jgi:hypothetical protein
MVDRVDLEAALLAIVAAVAAFVLFANGYFGPTRQWWRLYLGVFGLFVGLRALEWGVRKRTGE